MLSILISYSGDKKPSLAHWKEPLSKLSGVHVSIAFLIFFF